MSKEPELITEDTRCSKEACPHNLFSKKYKKCFYYSGGICLYLKYQKENNQK